MAAVENKSKIVQDAQSDPEHHSFQLTMSVRGQVSGFMEFVREQGVVGLAVGLTIGTSVTVFIKSIVDNLINPLVGALLPGGGNLSSKFSCLKSVGNECTNKLGWGSVINNFISFLIIAALVYVVVHILKLDKLDRKKET